MKTLGPTTQDHRIARLQAQRTGVGGHVGARFVDHADDAQRRAHAGDVQPAGLVPFGKDRADGIGLFRDAAQPVNDALNAVFVQSQAVHHRGRQTLVAAKLQILGIGRQDRVTLRPDGGSGADQRGMLAFGRGGGQFGRGRFGTRTDVGHQGGNVGEIFHRSGPYGRVWHNFMPPAGIFTAKRSGQSAMSSRWIRAARPG